MSNNKKTSTLTVDVFVVELIQKNWHQIEPELGRWRDILAIPWMRAKNIYAP